MTWALRAGRDPVPREAPMFFCSVIFVKSFLLLREGNHRIAGTDYRPSTSSRLRHRHRIPRNRGPPHIPHLRRIEPRDAVHGLAVVPTSPDAAGRHVASWATIVSRLRYSPVATKPRNTVRPAPRCYEVTMVPRQPTSGIVEAAAQAS